MRGTTGKSQDAVAQAVRSSRPTISRMERGPPMTSGDGIDVSEVADLVDARAVAALAAVT